MKITPKLKEQMEADIKIKQNKIISPKDEKVYFASPCKRAYLIDDPFVVDRMSGIPYRSFRVSDYTGVCRFTF